MKRIGIQARFCALTMAATLALGAGGDLARATDLETVRVDAFSSDMPAGWDATWYQATEALVVTERSADTSSPTFMVRLIQAQPTLDPAKTRAELETALQAQGALTVARDSWFPDGHLLVFDVADRGLRVAVWLARAEGRQRYVKAMLAAPEARFDQLDGVDLLRRVANSVRWTDRDAGPGAGGAPQFDAVVMAPLDDDAPEEPALDAESNSEVGIVAVAPSVADALVSEPVEQLVAAAPSTPPADVPAAVVEAVEVAADASDLPTPVPAIKTEAFETAAPADALESAGEFETAAVTDARPSAATLSGLAQYLDRPLGSVDVSPAPTARSRALVETFTLFLDSDGPAQAVMGSGETRIGRWTKGGRSITVAWPTEENGGRTLSNWRLQVFEDGLGVAMTRLRPVKELWANDLVGRLTLDGGPAPIVQADPNRPEGEATRIDFSADGVFSLQTADGETHGGQFAVTQSAVSLEFWDGGEALFEGRVIVGVNGAPRIIDLDGHYFRFSPI